MEINYSSVKALSSPTRLKILKSVLEDPKTPTQLSDEVSKTKSTVSDHLNKLCEAGLVEKDSKEGRRRVVYSPTTKAKVIANGSRRKVTFSIFSSALSTVIGAGLVASQYIGDLVQDDVVYEAETEMLEQPDAVPEMEQAAETLVFETLNPWIVAGVLLVIIGVLGITYFTYFKKTIINN